MALVGLLNAIDKEKYDVDLFLNQHTGPYMRLIPEGVNLLPEIQEYSVIERPFSYCLKKGLVKSAYYKLKSKYNLWKYIKINKVGSPVAPHIYADTFIEYLPSLHFLGEYDLAVSFLDPPHIVQDKVLAKKKIEWIHTDFTSFKYDADLTRQRWSANDYIISISDSITENFCKLFPELKPKIKLIENIISPDFVRQRAKEIIHFPDFNGSCILCSIGRINAEPKNFKSIPEISAKLKEKGLDFVWWIIGPGDQTEIRTLIDKYDVAEQVILLGPQTNPYPYIQACSIYVQPSLWEGKSITVREAQILCKPVIITNYPTSASQIVNGVDGVICGMDNDSIANCIFDMAKDQALRNRLSEYLSSHDYGMQGEVKKLYELI